MAEPTTSWRDKAVTAWRQHGLELRIKQLLDVDIDPSAVQTSADDSRILLDGVTFVQKSGTGELLVEAPCPRCHKMQPAVGVETLSDVGRAMDTLCRDCEFLVKSGMDTQAAAPNGRQPR